MNVHILNTQNTLFKKEKDWLTDCMHQRKYCEIAW